MNIQHITPEMVAARNATHPFTPAKWKNKQEPDLVVSWWVTEDKDGYFHAVLLGVAHDKDGDYIVEWSEDHGWCGLSGDRGAPLFP